MLDSGPGTTPLPCAGNLRVRRDPVLQPRAIDEEEHAEQLDPLEALEETLALPVVDQALGGPIPDLDYHRRPKHFITGEMSQAADRQADSQRALSD